MKIDVEYVKCYEELRSKIGGGVSVSQSEMAEKLGVSQPAVSAWLRGDNHISPGLCAKISRKYSLPLDRLHPIFRG